MILHVGVLSLSLFLPIHRRMNFFRRRMDLCSSTGRFKKEKTKREKDWDDNAYDFLEGEGGFNLANTYFKLSVKAQKEHDSFTKLLHKHVSSELDPLSG